MQTPGKQSSPRTQPTAFTLVELIISIGMVLILMTGIVKVFKYTTDAVGAGLAISDIVRAQRSLGTQIPDDMQQNQLPLGQGLTINTSNCPAILLDSQQNDPNSAGNPNTISTAAGGDFGVIQGLVYLDKDDQANPALNPSHQYRQDSISFFTKGNFTHQTGNGGTSTSGGTFVSALNSSWAWIWYGQLWLPTNKNSTSAPYLPLYVVSDNKTPSYPGAGDAAGNPNNFYARQWQLGRMSMLILPKNIKVGAGVSNTDIYSGYWPGVANPRYQSFIQEQSPPPASAPPPPPYSLQPLAFGSLSRDWTDEVTNITDNKKDPGVWAIQNSRYDLAGVTASSTNDPFVDYFIPRLTFSSASYVASWFSPVTDFVDAPTLTSLNYRFQANPYPVRNTSQVAPPPPALASNQAAGTVPALATGCVRFYVEYAGDFVNQNANGTINTAGATGNGVWNPTLATAAVVGPPFVPAKPYTGDGTDFYVDINGVHHIRWYGLPRDADGDGQILTTGVGGNLGPNASPQTADVLPLAYYLGTPSVPIPISFESNVSTAVNVRPWNAAWSTNPSSSGFNHYICQWDATSGALRPTMFRITIELIDADGRLSSPRVLQYIIPVAQS